MEKIRRIRKIYVGVDYKDCYCLVVGQKTYSGNEIHCILEDKDEEKFDVYIKKGNTTQFWKDFYKSKVISTEDFID